MSDFKFIILKLNFGILLTYLIYFLYISRFPFIHFGAGSFYANSIWFAPLCFLKLLLVK